MNLVNSKCYHNINDNNNIFYLHCTKIGPKLLKFIFNIIICHKI